MNRIELTVNGNPVCATVDPRISVGDFVREELNLTATHLACEHGVCGACTILLDGVPVRGCITLAVAVEGRQVQTLEDFADDPLMNLIRSCFSEAHGLQCGFCTPGMLLMARDMIRRGVTQSADQIRHELAGNICRCTGYAGIVKAVQLAAERAQATGLATQQNHRLQGQEAQAGSAS